MTPYAWLYRIMMDRLIEVWRHENRDCRDPDREMHWPERSSIQMGLDTETVIYLERSNADRHKQDVDC
jgi:DNA-directed RNA polymerase specialized sigma24 family protein